MCILGSIKQEEMYFGGGCAVWKGEAVSAGCIASVYRSSVSRQEECIVFRQERMRNFRQEVCNVFRQEWMCCVCSTLTRVASLMVRETFSTGQDVMHGESSLAADTMIIVEEGSFALQAIMIMIIRTTSIIIRIIKIIKIIIIKCMIPR